jgi:AcrR family transcriptional regulator
LARHDHGRPAPGRQELAEEAVRELVLAKLAQKASKYDRSTPKGRIKAEAIEAVAAEIGALDVWTRPAPRGRLPQLTREAIAATAVRLADEGGLDELSMRRLAGELGVGTMSLYHYIRTKDELLSLVTDAVMAEVVVPPEVPLPGDDWRQALMIIAKRSRAAFKAHPWMLDISDHSHAGPHSVHHLDQTLAAVASLDVPLAEKLNIAAMTDEYVFGYSLRARHHRHGYGAEVDERTIRYMSLLLQTGGYPHLEALTAELPLPGLWAEVSAVHRDESRFEQNLERLFDGIEKSLRPRL